ncbi:MAG: tetratricopeptide repeat protein, partial [Spirochaetota bacterium]
DPNGALRDITRAIELEPKLALAYLARARMYRTAGRNENALSDYTAAIDHDPALVSARLERGELRLLELGDKGGADDYRDAYRIDPANLRAALSWAGHLQWEDPDEARRIFDSVVELHPQREQALVGRAKFRRDRGDFTGALADFERALEHGSAPAWIIFEAAMAELSVGDTDAARVRAGQLVERHPDAPVRALLAARLAAFAGDPAAALAAYDAYLAYEWVDRRVLLERTFANAALGRPEAARADLERYAREKDDELTARLVFGAAATLGGDPAGGIAVVEDLVTEHEWMLPAWYVLATADPERETVHGIARDGFIERLAGFKPAREAFLPFHPHLWVWTELFLAANADARPIVSW